MAAKHSFWHGWNLALEAVREAVTEVPDESLTPEQSEFKKAIVGFLDPLFPGEDLLKRRPTNAELADKYGCSLRTIANWKREGCPLEDGQWRVLDWLSDRHCLPKGTAAKYAKQFARRNGDDLDELGSLRQQGKALLRLVRQAGL